MLGTQLPQAGPRSTIQEGTPVNAANAARVLTVGAIPLDNETVSIGGQVYKFENAIAAGGVKAYATFTSAAIAAGNKFKIGSVSDYTFRDYVGIATKAASDGVFSSFVADTKWIKLDTITYTYKTALTEKKAQGTVTVSGTPLAKVDNIDATGTITVTGTPVGNEELVVGAQTFLFKAARSGAGEITIDADNTNQAVNIVAAITADLATVTASNTLGVVIVTSVAHGTAGNAIPLTEAATGIEVSGSGTLENGTDAVAEQHLVVGAQSYKFVNLRGGVGEITISADNPTQVTNIVAAITADSTDVTAVDGALDTVLITAATIGVAGNALTFTEDATGIAVDGAGTLGTTTAGVNSIANEILVEATAEAALNNFVSATTGGAGVGVKYSTLTVAHATVDVTKTNASTIHAVAKSTGDAGNLFDTTTDSADFAWTGLVLAGGHDLQDTAYDVWLGVSDEAAIDNAVLAISAGAGAGTNYGTGTVAHTQVDSAKTAADTLTVTAKTIGDAGNAIALTNTGNFTKSSATLLHGEDTEAANGVLIGASAETSIENLVSAILTTAGDEGVKWGTGTVTNAYCTAAKTTPSTMTATAIVAGGTTGNAIAIAETLSNAGSFWAGGTTVLGGGVDGTEAPKGKIMFDTSNVYVATAENSVSGKNWKKTALGAL